VVAKGSGNHTCLKQQVVAEEEERNQKISEAVINGKGFYITL